MKHPQLSPLISRRDAAKILAVSVPTLKRHSKKDPEFPRPVMIGPTRVGFRSDEISDYQERLAERAAERECVPPRDPSVAGRLAGAAAKARAAKRTAETAKPALAVTTMRKPASAAKDKRKSAP